MTWPSRGTWVRELGTVLVLALAVGLPRLVVLDADPPPDLEQSYLSDEGYWLHNARHRVLFGRWNTDEQNAALYAAPVYTAVLAGVYTRFGIGFLQTRLVAAVSGILACLFLYGALRARHERRLAFLASLVLGVSYFTLTQNRIGLPESFQLLLVVMSALAVYLAAERPGWAFVGGVAFVAAQLAKPSALAMGPVVVAFWVGHWILARRQEDLPRWSWRGPVWWASGAGAGVLLVLLLLVLPNWEGVRNQALLNLRNVYRADLARPDMVSLFGIPQIQLALNGFWLQTIVPLTGIVLLLVAGLGRVERRPVTLLQVFGWSWFLLGLAFLSLQRYQPDRRFLLLMPAVAVLLAAGLDRGGIPLPWGGERVNAGRRLVMGAVLGGFVGLYLHPVLLQGLRAAAGRLLGVHLSPARAAPLVWSGAIVLGAIVCWLWRDRLPRTSRVVPSWFVVALFLLLEPGRWVLHAARPTYLLRDTSRQLRALTAGWGPADKVVIARSADSYALETDLFAVPYRRPWPGAPPINADAWKRFRPAMALSESAADRIAPSEEDRRRRGFVLVGRYGVAPDKHGQPRVAVAVYVRQDLCPSCVTAEP